MSGDHERRLDAAGKRRAATRPSAQQKRPKLAPFDAGVYCERITVRRAAEAIPRHLRPRFMQIARAIAAGEPPEVSHLIACADPRLIHWRQGSPPEFAVLTELGLDVAFALVEQGERDLRAMEFGTLFPRQQARALIRGPCPACDRPLIHDAAPLCARCSKLVPESLRDACYEAARAALYAPQQWAAGSRRDSAWLAYRTAAIACTIAARLRLAE